MKPALAFAEILLLLCMPTQDEAPSKVKPDAVLSDLTGIYSCHGSTGSGAEYTGSCIIYKFGEGYIFLWTTIIVSDKGIGSLTMKGTGMRKGDSISVAWGNEKGNGINVYKVGEKNLVGEWLESSSIGKKQTETLTKVAALPGGFN